jgi:AraC-like DNA-binding protein
MTRRRQVIRLPRPGERPPAGVKRYKNANGYIRLRWLASPSEFVECYEHRWVAGVVHRPEVQVHHRNHIKDDNRPENLEIVSPSDHSKHHARIDPVHVRKAYEAGQSFVKIAAELGCDRSAVLRAFRRAGGTPRSKAEAWKLRRRNAAAILLGYDDDQGTLVGAE